MLANSHHTASTLCVALFAATILLAVGGPAVRTIAELDSLLARISLRAAEIMLAALRVCGI
jgi:hypothetical protein